MKSSTTTKLSFRVKHSFSRLLTVENQDPGRVRRSKLLPKWQRVNSWLNRFAVGDGSRWCLVFWKPTVIKGVPAAHLIGVSDTELLREWQQAIGGHLLLHHGVLASRIDAHLSPKANWPGISRPVAEPHLVRATPALPPEQVSFLYSELAALPL